MDGNFEVLLWVVGIAIAIIIGIFAMRAAEARRKELEAVARELGWRFRGSSDSGVAREIGRISIFARGRSQRGYNTMRGSIDLCGRSCAAMMGDFQYTTGSGKDKRTHHFSYLVIDPPWSALPDFAVRREGFVDRIAGALGFDDIDFESAEFSRRFHVKCADKRFAYDLIHPRMMEFLMENGCDPFMIETGCFCISNGSGRWSGVEFRQRPAWAQQFFELWPEHLQADLSQRRIA